MSLNPVEENVVTRFILGFAVIMAMFAGGGAVGSTLQDSGVPYGGVLGTALGAIVVFLAFVVLYRRYDASFTE
jgi:hypothetical protein